MPRASVTATYRYASGEAVQVTVKASGYPDAISDARAQAVRGVVELVDRYADEATIEELEQAVNGETNPQDD